jgi:hypothetical protein
LSRYILDLTIDGFESLPGPHQAPTAQHTAETQLWVHADAEDVGLLARSGRPMIYTAGSALTTRSKRKSLEQAVHAHRETQGSAADVLVDPNMYAGTGRTFGATNVDPGFLAFQADLGLSTIVTDSGYIRNGDFSGIEQLLRYGADQNRTYGGRVTVDIAIDHQMVGTAADRIRDLFERYQTPVALKLAHPTDPFKAERNISGLIHLLGGSVPVDLGRTDIAGIGGLAVGARRVSIGTTTGLRHVYPPTEKKGGGAGRLIEFAILVPQALIFRAFPRVLEAVGLQPDDPRWVCLCAHCAGRSIESIRNEQSAWEHSLNLLFDLGDSVLRLPEQTERMKTWSSQCGFADSINQEIRDGLASWPVGSNLRNWKRALDAALAG